MALAIALRLEDRGVAAVVAARLRWSATRAFELLGEGDGQLPAAPSALLRLHLRAAQRLLDDVPVDVTPRELHRLQRWVAAPPSLGGAGGNADLFDLQGRGRELTSTVFSQLHLLQCQLERAHLGRACFREAFVDSCELTAADARESRWGGAVVMRSRLAGASLFAAELAGAIFSDCDLRGADLRDRPGGSGASRSMWIRCDLRNTVWKHRDLAGAHFVGCRLAGARELEAAPGTYLVRCQPPTPGELAELAAQAASRAAPGAAMRPRPEAPGAAA